MMANWRELIAECADGDEIIHCTLPDDELLVDFADGYGWAGGDEFTAWSQDYVYFPAVSDEGNEWVDRVPRNPRDTATKHVGGHQK